MKSKKKSGEARVWEEMTVEEMRGALRKTKTAIVPLGVTEQHGYHLPLGTDTYDAWEIAKRVSARTGAVVAPPVPYSFSGGGLTGTINISPQVMSLLVQEIVASIVLNGFRNIVLLLGHGGSENYLALKDALQLYLRNNPHLKDVALVFAPVWQFGKHFQRGFKKGDFHAGEIETSLMIYLKPELVRKNRMILDPPRLAKMQRENPDNYQLVEKIVNLSQVVPRIRQRPDIRVGVMGYPKSASAGLGRRIVEEITDGISKLICQVEQQKGTRYRRIRVKRCKLAIV